MIAGGSVRRQAPQHIRQDAAIVEVVDFILRIDAGKQRHVLGAAILEGNGGRHLLARFDRGKSLDRHGFRPVEAQRLPASTYPESSFRRRPPLLIPI